MVVSILRMTIKRELQTEASGGDMHENKLREDGGGLLLRLQR
jgi:hypothetical protein